jgi:iron(III) transport system substrate-binding protein
MNQSHRARPSYVRGVALTLVITLLGACGGSGAASPAPTVAATSTVAATATADAWAEVMAAAKKEGTSTSLFTETPGWIEAQQNLFKQQTGLEMAVAARGANGVLETRLTAEVGAGAIQTDVYEDVDRSFYAAHLDWFVDLSKAGLPNYASYTEKGKWKNVCIDVKWSVSGYTYNTNLVSEADAPKTWQDLVNPKFKGQVVLSDPKPGGYYMQWALIMRNAFGPTYLQQVAALNPTLMSSSVGAAQQVGAGAKMLSFLSQVDSGSDVAKAGAPVKFRILRNPDVGSQACVGILKNSPHPATAKVLLNFLMTPDSQSAPCKAGIPNVSPIKAPGCFEVPADWVPPTLTDKGTYQGMDDEALKAQALKELGIQ